MRECPWQERVEAAAYHNVREPDIDAHIRECDDCRALGTTIRVLRAEGRAAERAALGRVPSAGAILADARSRPAGNPAGGRNALWPIVWLERIAAILLSIATIGAGAWLVDRGSAAWLAWVRRSAEAVALVVQGDVASALVLVAAITVVAITLYGLMAFSSSTEWRA